MLQVRATIEPIVVTAEQMRQIEGRIFAAGMPVAALMEKVAQLITTRIQELYPPSKISRIGVLVGPGHNGGDGLVIARELHLQDYQISIYCPVTKLKELTTSHANYARSLQIPFFTEIQSLQNCDLIIDALFGFGLTRPITGAIATAINQLNQWSKLVVSIDLPSGIHTDTGTVLGTAVYATYTLCLGLWKLAFCQDQALECIGKAELIDFGIPLVDIEAILGQFPNLQRMTAKKARQFLPIPRPLVTHKYQQGHFLLIGGSRRYAGSIILAGLGARASGVGMLSIAVPESLQPILVSQLPEALIIGCPETDEGVIAQLPTQACQWQNYTIVACGPGITTKATSLVQNVLTTDKPLILDADGLNILAQLGTQTTLALRKATTVLTPHLGEFKRLFPEITSPSQNQVNAAQIAAHTSGAIVLLKGARSVIAPPDGSGWSIPESTPALARGGSGDVLTGLMGGLMAQNQLRNQSLSATVATAAWCHAQAGILAAQARSQLGVDGVTLASYLTKVYGS